MISSNGALAFKAIYCLRALGYSVHVAATRDIVALRRSRYVDSFRCFDHATFDQELRAWAQDMSPALIMPVEVAAFAAAHRLRSADPTLPIFPCSDADLLDRLDNKAAFTEMAVMDGVPVPRSIRLDALDGLEARLAEAIGYPLVLKSLYGESSRGVARTNSFAEVERLLATEQFKRLPLQAQSYVDGPVVGLNLLCVDGDVRAASTYRKRDADTLAFEPIPSLEPAISPMLHRLRFSGLANFDAILTPDRGPLFLECNPRVWYNMQADRWMGLNFIAAGLAALSGNHAPTRLTRTGDYVFPLRLLREMARLAPAAWRASAASYCGLWEVLSDPIGQISRNG